ncbi:hypothetical protein [Methylobacterium sp. JK268]
MRPRRGPCRTTRLLAAGALLGAAGGASGQERSLVLPHVEGERQGTILGRAIACGAPEARTQAAARAASERMRRLAGPSPWQDRFLPAFNDAASLAAALPPASCAEALTALDALERDAPP